MRYLCVLFFFVTLQGFAQIDVPLTAKVEPDYFERLKKVEEKLYAIVKTKGNNYGKSEYKCLSFNQDLTLAWEQELLLSKNENLVYFQVTSNETRAFVVDVDLKKESSTLKVHRWSNRGNKISLDTLQSVNVKPWLSYGGKGMVKQSFQGEVSSKQQTNAVTPLLYKYYLKESPDRSKLLVYRFDHGKKVLESLHSVYDLNLTLLATGEIPIDHRFVLYDVTINNGGNVVLAKANEAGKVGVVSYDLVNSNHRYLGIEISNLKRDNLKLSIIDNDRVALVKLNKIRGELQSLSLSVFDFNFQTVKKSVALPLSEEFKQSLRLKEKEAGYSYNEEWKNFRVQDFWLDTEGNSYVVLEEQSIEGVTFQYDENAVVDVNDWFPVEGQVKCGTLIVMKINVNQSMDWVYGIPKHQLATVEEGLTTISTLINRRSDSSIDIIFSESGNGITNNILSQIYIDAEGNKFEKRTLSNPNNLVMQRPYFIGSDTHVIWVGKKGLMGKKANLEKTKL